MRWSHLVRRGLVGSSLLAAGSARATPCDQLERNDVGVVVGIDIAPRVRLVGGIELRKCLADTSEAMVRFELGGGAPRVIGGVRARPFESNNATDTSDSLGIEAGLALDTHAKFGAHLAGVFANGEGYFAVQLLQPLGEARPARSSLLLGYAPELKMYQPVNGRPIERDGRFVLPDVSRADAGDAEDRAVFDHFARSAQLEASSVWTFLRLAAELAAVGAPSTLIAAALDAADDEVRHADLCAAAAGGIRIAALPDGVAAPRFAARSHEALATLAREAWREGALNEGAASAEASYAAAQATGAGAAMLETIARDERRHAELAWSVLAWIAQVAPMALFAQRLAAPPAPTFADVDAAVVRRGVASAAARTAAWHDAVGAARRRLAQLA